MKYPNETPLRLWAASPLAARLGVDKKWLVSEADAGRIPGVAAGRTWLFDPVAVESVLLRRARERGLEEASGNE